MSKTKLEPENKKSPFLSGKGMSFVCGNYTPTELVILAELARRQVSRSYV